MMIDFEKRAGEVLCDVHLGYEAEGLASIIAFGRECWNAALEEAAAMLYLEGLTPAQASDRIRELKVKP